MFVNGAARRLLSSTSRCAAICTHRSHQAYFYDSTKHLYMMSSSVFKRAYTASSRTYSSIIPYRMSNRINGVNRHFVQYRYRARLRPSFRRSTQRLFTTAAEEENAQAVETALQRVMRLQSEKQFRTYGGGFLILGMSVWIYGSTIIDYFSGNVAEVTSKSIASVEVQSEVQSLAIGAVNTVLQDKQVLGQTVSFLQDLVKQPETQVALVTLLVSALQNPETQKEVQNLSKNVVNYILNDKQTLEQVTILLGNVLQQPWTKKVVLDLLKQLMEDEQTREALGRLLVSTLARDDIVQSSTDVAMSATHNVLNDEEVGKHAAFWMQQVLGDSNIQKKSGEHLWNAFTYAINPFGRGTQSDAGVKAGGDKSANVGKSNRISSEAETKTTK